MPADYPRTVFREKPRNGMLIVSSTDNNPNIEKTKHNRFAALPVTVEKLEATLMSTL